MNFIIDTFSWKKLDIISEKELIKIEKLYDKNTIHITHEILKEIQYWNLKSCIVSKVHILPIKNQKIFQSALDLKFDLADATILSNGTTANEMIIVTEDKPLIIQAKSHQFTVVQLIEFFIILTQMEIISKKGLFRINKELHQMHNISNKLEKSVRGWLQTN